MRYDVEINGRIRRVATARVGEAFSVTVDGRIFQVSAVRVDAQTLSLLVSGRIFEVTIVPDRASAQLAVGIGDATVLVGLNNRRRWDKRDDGAHGGVGPQRLVAPMPGKVVRVLVQSGEVVCERQPLVVVEAMKMENELRAVKSGTVVEVHAREGLSVEAGATLVVIQ